MGNGLLRQVLVSLCLLCSVLSGFAQAAGSAAQQEQAVIRTTTRLVQVSVIVQDKKGQPLAGLTRDDFTVLDNGKGQKISFFSVESSRSLPGPAQPLPPNVFSNRWETRADVPTSVTVILLDALNTRFEDQAYARQQIIKFLGQLQPQDRVALYALGSNLQIVHDFTSDATPLLRALERYRGRIPSELAASDPEDADAPGSSAGAEPELARFDAFFNDATQRVAEFYTIRRAEQTLRAIEAIANHVSRLPGRKNLIWVSGSFPAWIGYDSLNPTAERRTFSPEIGRTAQALNDASLAVYPVDARGLVPDPDFSAARRSPPSGKGLAKVRLSIDTMNELAERTGGRAFYNSNDIKGAIRAAIDDSQLTYVLGYYPADVKWDSSFREIKVRVNRPGMRIRWRRGYFALPEGELDEKQRKAVLNDATWSPLDATGVGIFARLEPPKNPADNQVGVALMVDPRDVTLQPQSDHWVGSLDLLLVQKDAEGKVLTGTSKTFNMNLKSETYKKMAQEGLVLTGAEKLAAGAAELRIIVRDAPSGALGSVSIPLRKAAAQSAAKPPKTSSTKP